MTINEEAGLPENWLPVDVPPIQPGQPSQPTSPSSYFVGTLPPSIQHDAQFVRTGYQTGSVAVIPLMPVASGGVPSNNASVQTVVKSSSISYTSVPGGIAGDVQVNNGAGGFGGKTLVPLVNGGTGSNLSSTGGTSQVLVQSAPGAAVSVGQLAFTDISGVTTTGQIPNLPASIITSGHLALAYGGTNADLSATGAASNVLKQVSAGAAITVGQLAASDLSNGTTGTGAIALATSPTFVTGATAPKIVLTGATPTTIAGQVGLGTTVGFGAGSAGTAVTTTTLGAGTGPSTPQTVVNYLELDIAGTKYWVPLVQ